MNVVNISQSVYQTFTNLNNSPESNYRPLINSRNQYCGNFNYNNYGGIYGAASSEIMDKMRAIQAAISLTETLIDRGWNTAKRIAGIADSIDSVAKRIDGIFNKDDEDNIDSSIKDLEDSTDLNQYRCHDVLDQSSDEFKLKTVCDDLDKIKSKCNSNDLMGMLAVGMSNLVGDIGSGFNFSNPIIGLASIAMNANTIGARTNIGLANMGSSIATKQLTNLIGPEASQYLAQTGMLGFMQTSLSAKLLEAIDPKTASACQMSSMYNRYNNFDPFTGALLQVTGLANANGDIYYGGSGVPSAALSAMNDCMQARQLSRNLSTMARVYDTNYESTNYYQRSTTANVNGYNSPFTSNTSQLQQNDVYASTITQYGFQDNMMSTNLGTDLENYRNTTQIRNQFSQVQTDPSRLQDFAAESKLSLNYMSQINTNRLQTNMYVRDSLQQSLQELNGN